MSEQMPPVWRFGRSVVRRDNSAVEQRSGMRSERPYDRTAVRQGAARRGALLILVAGIAALMVALSVAFLTRMRADAEENAMVVREAQARLMLVAACSYVQEASRLGWDDPATPEHEEGYGWVDVRDGKLGPKPVATGADDASRFPIGRAGRFPMHAMVRPPYAVSPAQANPMETDSSSATFGVPLLRNADPERVVDNFPEWKAGDRTPRQESLNLAWFRVCRIGPARFAVTCGAGATQGFKDWSEVLATAGASQIFGADPTFAQQVFEQALAGESRLWYLIEWSPAVGDHDYQNLDNEQGSEHYAWRGINRSNESRAQSHVRNMVGTISVIQRLPDAPRDGKW